MIDQAYKSLFCELCDPDRKNPAIDTVILSVGGNDREYRIFYTCADCRSRYLGFVLDRIPGGRSLPEQFHSEPKDFIVVEGPESPSIGFQQVKWQWQVTVDGVPQQPDCSGIPAFTLEQLDQLNRYSK